MPNEVLIQQIESLRDRYARQQKNAAGLQTAFKSVIDGHNRAQKALTEYGDQNSGADVSDAQMIFANARLKETIVDPLTPALRREIKALTVLNHALKEAAGALRVEPIDVVRLDKAISALQTGTQSDIMALLPELNSELEVGQRALGDEFGAKLRDALAEQGIPIGGRAPKFQIGRFELDANFAKRFISLRYGLDLVIPRAPITVDAAIKAYQSAAKTVTERSQDGKVWMNQLYEAYLIVQRKRSADTARANLVDCYLELVLLRQGRAFIAEPSKRTFTDYSRAQFIHDFYEFTSRQRLAGTGGYVKAHVATKSQVESPTKSMWIVEGDTPFDGRYIADIEFVRD